jgi:hypothetical protein
MSDLPAKAEGGHTPTQIVDASPPGVRKVALDAGLTLSDATPANANASLVVAGTYPQLRRFLNNLASFTAPIYIARAEIRQADHAAQRKGITVVATLIWAPISSEGPDAVKQRWALPALLALVSPPSDRYFSAHITRIDYGNTEVHLEGAADTFDTAQEYAEYLSSNANPMLWTATPRIEGRTEHEKAPAPARSRAGRPKTRYVFAISMRYYPELASSPTLEAIARDQVQTTNDTPPN